MRKILLLIFMGFFYSSSIHAQNKYALLVGINDYYSEPGVKSSQSLQGCVNDMISVKTLLMDRFAFPPSNIIALSDSQATKKTILTALRTLLDRCKPGDAMIFFYSGHGVWIDNLSTMSDSVKRGMNQAIVTSDLYAENWECLLKDATLKKSFNLFVDKKVKVTTIFDCCYSANLMMKPGPFGENVYERPHIRSTEKFITLRYVPYVPKIVTPVGCAVATYRVAKDTVDTDHDGVPDCADYEINTPLACLPVDSSGVGFCEEDDIDFLPDEELTKPSRDTMVSNESMRSARAFNLVDKISIPDAEVVPRPSERPNSGFLSIAGTTDKEKGLEITDETGIKHGAFTKALLAVYRENPANLTVSELLKKISQSILQQQYKQTPTYHYDPGRLGSNLIGTDAAPFTKSIVAKCADTRSGLIILDKGTTAGISKGNILTNTSIAGKVRVQVLEAQETSATATAIDLRMATIKKGTEFILADPYTTSGPLVKVYIAGSPLNAVTFNALFEKKIRPLVNLPNYRDYNRWTNLEPSFNIFFSETNPVNPGIMQSVLNGDTTYFHVFLPIPGYIADALKQVLKKDQNVEVVDALSKAEFVLYLNYAKPREDRKGEFIFTFCKPISKTQNEFGDRPFFAYHVGVPSMNFKNDELAKLAERIDRSAREVIRGKSSRWLNDYQKR